METIAPKPPFPHCRVEVVPSAMVVHVHGCTRMRGCVGNGHSPGETQDAREVGVSLGDDVGCAVAWEMDIPRVKHRMRGK